ncbi:MAG: RNase P subunit p30 family protein [Candidatus Aenigmatarchaeota archaeon]
MQSNLSGGESTIEQITDFAKRLGYSGIVICDNYQGLEKIKELKTKVSEIKSEIEVYCGVNIIAKNVNEMKEIVNKVRERVHLIVVSGGDYSINRAACEDSRVDILMHPELGRSDIGLDEACFKAATQNNVAIGISFREILFNFRKQRAYILNHISKILRLCDHFRTPIVICSCAQSIWGLRNPRDLVSLINTLGLDIGKAFATITSVPQTIIEENKKTLEGKKITEGVEIVE